MTWEFGHAGQPEFCFVYIPPLGLATLSKVVISHLSPPFFLSAGKEEERETFPPPTPQTPPASR